MPVRTCNASMPQFSAPTMSVSIRSPTMSGRVAPVRRSASSNKPRSGLPATATGSAPVARRTVSTSDAVAGRGAAGRGEGLVRVAHEPRHPGLDRVAGLRQVPPADIGVEALHHGDRIVVRRRDTAESPAFQRNRQPRPADDQHRASRGHRLGHDPGDRLARRHHVGLAGIQPEPRICSATSAAVREALFVRNANRHVPRVKLADRLDRVGHRQLAAVDDAVQIEHRQVVGRDQGSRGSAQRHPRRLVGGRALDRVDVDGDPAPHARAAPPERPAQLATHRDQVADARRTAVRRTLADHAEHSTVSTDCRVRRRAAALRGTTTRNETRWSPLGSCRSIGSPETWPTKLHRIR